jgi:hypothetical protein
VRGLGGDDTDAGLLMAALPAGYVAGVYAITRWPGADLRRRLLGPLGLVTCLPLLAVGLRPDLLAMAALLALVGFLAGHQAIANAEFVRLAPVEHRGLLIGLIGAALTGAQGALMMAAGALAEYVGAAEAIALLGAAGVAAAVPLVRRPRPAL